MTADDTYFKYVPIISLEVKRSFSAFKTFLSDNRRSFLFENIMCISIIRYSFNDKKKIII